MTKSYNILQPNDLCRLAKYGQMYNILIVQPCLYGTSCLQSLPENQAIKTEEVSVYHDPITLIAFTRR